MSEPIANPTWVDRFIRWFIDWLSTPTELELKIFEGINSLVKPLSDWLTNLPPNVWHLTAVGLFVVSGVATFLVPRRYIYADAPTQRAWRDLRLWTAVALAPYIAAYYFLQ